jgi:hypothetical protein
MKKLFFVMAFAIVSYSSFSQKKVVYIKENEPVDYFSWYRFIDDPDSSLYYMGYGKSMEDFIQLILTQKGFKGKVPDETFTDENGRENKVYRAISPDGSVQEVQIMKDTENDLILSLTGYPNE